MSRQKKDLNQRKGSNIVMAIYAEENLFLTSISAQHSLSKTEALEAMLFHFNKMSPDEVKKSFDDYKLNGRGILNVEKAYEAQYSLQEDVLKKIAA